MKRVDKELNEKTNQTFWQPGLSFSAKRNIIMFRSSFQEERVAKDSKLQAVFSKLSGVLPRAEDFQGNTIPKIMSSDIIESVLADTPVPVPTSKFPFVMKFLAVLFFAYLFSA